VKFQTVGNPFKYGWYYGQSLQSNGGFNSVVGPSIIQAKWSPTISSSVALQSHAPHGVVVPASKSHLDAIA